MLKIQKTFDSKYIRSTVSTGHYEHTYGTYVRRRAFVNFPPKSKTQASSSLLFVATKLVIMVHSYYILLFASFAAYALSFSTNPITGRTQTTTRIQAIRADQDQAEILDEKQIDFTMGYLNKHHSDILLAFVETFSDLGQVKSKKNTWSGGAFVIEQAKLVDINAQGTNMKLEATIKERGQESRLESVTVDMDASPILNIRTPNAKIPPIPANGTGLKKQHPVDDLVRRLIRLCNIVDKPSATGKLIQLAIQIGGTGIGELKENLYLNNVPHTRYVRQYFYEMATEAVLEAVILCSEGKLTNRMELVSMFPEMNPSMDSYRIGTLLELTRTITIKLCENNLRVRICVQSSMGEGIFTGVPKQLSGVAKLLQLMDWQSNPGEENEGMVGNYLNFGSIGKEHVVNTHTLEDGTKVEQDDVFILIAPQSMVGVDSSIIGPLQEMVEAAGDRPVILINPDLTDKVSSQGQQNVRGRQQRIGKKRFQARMIVFFFEDYVPP